MAARTVREVIEGALRLVGAIAQGEPPAPEDVNTGLKILQDLIAEWGDGGLVVPSVVKETFNLAPVTNSYTIGKIGAPDFDTICPEQIIGAFIRVANHDYPITIIGEGAYRNISNKSTSGRPTKLWYNPTAPLGTIYLWMTPSAIEALWITSVKPFAIPAGLAEKLFDTTEIPRNYHNAIKWNLALDLCPEYGKTASQVIIGRAKITYDKIVSLNAARRVEPVSVDVLTGSGNNNRDLIGG